MHFSELENKSITNDQILTIAEESGLIISLGESIFEIAFTKLKLFEKKYNKQIKMGINLSRKQLIQPDFFNNLYFLIKKYNIDPTLIIFEIGENSILYDVEEFKILLTTLRKVGCEIYIDNFGTGYSGMTLLRKFPLSGIKLDRDFIKGMCDDPSVAVLVKLSFLISNHLNLKLICVGIETQSELDLIRSLSPDQKYQGYIRMHPVSEKEIDVILDEHFKNTNPTTDSVQD